MNITLKNVKIHMDMSQETNCRKMVNLGFSATIYRDGKRVGTVGNTGDGGPHRYDWHYSSHEVGREISAWADTQETEFDFEKLDQIIDKMVASYDELRQLKNWCKKSTLIQLKGDDENSWRTFKHPYDDKMKAHLKAKYGTKITRIANEEIINV